MKPVIIKTESGKFEAADLQRWLANLTRFAAPLFAMYIAFVIAQINLDGFSWNDFIPNDLTIGGMILYFLNGVYDGLRKYMLPQTYIITPK